MDDRDEVVVDIDRLPAVRRQGAVPGRAASSCRRAGCSAPASGRRPIRARTATHRCHRRPPRASRRSVVVSPIDAGLRSIRRPSVSGTRSATAAGGRRRSCSQNSHSVLALQGRGRVLVSAGPVHHRLARLPLPSRRTAWPRCPSRAAGSVWKRNRSEPSWSRTCGGPPVVGEVHRRQRRLAPGACRVARDRPQVEPLRLVGAGDVVHELLGPHGPSGDPGRRSRSPP